MEGNGVCLLLRSFRGSFPRVLSYGRISFRRRYVAAFFPHLLGHGIRASLLHVLEVRLILDIVP